MCVSQTDEQKRFNQMRANKEGGDRMRKKRRKTKQSKRDQKELKVTFFQ